MVERHEGDAFGTARVMEQAFGKRFRIEAFDEVAVAGDVECTERIVGRRNVLTQHAQIAIRARRKQKREPHRLGTQRLVERCARQVIECGCGLDDPLSGCHAHSEAAVEHAIDRRGRYPGGARDIARAGPRNGCARRLGA